MTRRLAGLTVACACAGAALAPAAAAGEEPRAYIAAMVPDDPAFPHQWDLGGPFGIRMPEAWATARRKGAPGGRGTVVAVLDTGVAYRTIGDKRRAPDLRNFVPGYDFVDRDRLPLDPHGHGTHVAGTIAESTDNGTAAAGIAYRARIMPVRVLDAGGGGDPRPIASGIRYAARHGADVINMSFEFAPSVDASEIPAVVSAVRYARAKGAVLVGSAGNEGVATVSYPARAPEVLAVGATTERGCQAVYSNGGPDLDIVAPGGGSDAADAGPQCRPGVAGAPIYQQTFSYDLRHFGLRGKRGTSMAAPHVSGVAAMVIAEGRAARRPLAPSSVEDRIESTARDLGPEGRDERYGHGLLDAASAVR